MKKTVIAVIGCGRIASSAHFPALAKMENITIKYACDILPEKAQAMKEKYPVIGEVITDYKVALADPEVEAVFVLTPNRTHFTVTMDALAAGKHVFCEKPITINYALSKEMAEAAEKAGKLLVIGVCNRYHKAVEQIAKMNREGKFGNLYHVVCNFRSCRSIPGLGGAFTTKEESGGGVLIDWGVHYLDLILYILGNPRLKTVTCDSYCEIAKDMKSYKYKSMWAEDTADVENGTNDVDDFITGHIRTEGPSISFNGAWAQNLDQKDTYIDFLGDQGGARLYYAKDFEVFDGATLETVKPEIEPHKMHELEDIAFIDAVQQGRITRSHINNVLQSAQLLDSLYQSADKKEEIKL